MCFVFRRVLDVGSGSCLLRGVGGCVVCRCELLGVVNPCIVIYLRYYIQCYALIP